MEKLWEREKKRSENKSNIYRARFAVGLVSLFMCMAGWFAAFLSDFPCVRLCMYVCVCVCVSEYTCVSRPTSLLASLNQIRRDYHQRRKSSVFLD